MNLNSTKKAFSFFYEEVGAKYPEEEEVYRTLRGRLRKVFILSYLQQMRGSLLDIGCNSGHYLAAYTHGSRWGVDISRSVMRRIPLDLHAHLVVLDAERLFGFRPNNFDNVLCSEVLEHCTDPLLVFSSIAHVLKPGGKALITTPNYKGRRPDWVDMGSLSDYNVQGDIDGKYFHTAYHPQELAVYAQTVGLQVLQSGTLEKEIKYAAKLPAAVLISGRLLNRLIRSRKIEQSLLRVFNALSIGIYQFCRFTHLQNFFLRFVGEGVRSFVWLEKPTNQPKFARITL
jgi:SAM-dependent methyltransferase